MNDAITNMPPVVWPWTAFKNKWMGDYMKTIRITKKEEGQRLDKLLAKYLDLAPKSFVYKMLRKKNITLNGKKADGSEKLKESDQVTLFLTDETIEGFSKPIQEFHPNLQIDILYEDDDVILVNKPAGVLSQKAKEGDSSLVEWITGYLLDEGKLRKEELKQFRPGVCNRLDRNTSGIVMAGKTMRGLRTLGEMLRGGQIDKYYLGVVKGSVEGGKTLKGYLYKDKGRNIVRVLNYPAEGADAIETVYEPIRRMKGCTLLRIQLITGKSHQIRAHLADVGHPVIGDAKYGDKAANRAYKEKYGIRSQLLHASEVVFPENMVDLDVLSGKSFIAPLPDYFERVIKE